MSAAGARRLIAAAAVLALAAAGACARPAGTASADARVESTRSSRRIITAEDVVRASPEVTHAFDVVQRLRPEFLRPERRATVSAAPVVYINNQRAGGIDALRTIPRALIARIELLTVSEASLRFSDSRGSPVILVRTVQREN